MFQLYSLSDRRYEALQSHWIRKIICKLPRIHPCYCSTYNKKEKWKIFITWITKWKDCLLNKNKRIFTMLFQVKSMMAMLCVIIHITLHNNHIMNILWQRYHDIHLFYPYEFQVLSTIFHDHLCDGLLFVYLCKPIVT